MGLGAGSARGFRGSALAVPQLRQPRRALFGGAARLSCLLFRAFGGELRLTRDVFELLGADRETPRSLLRSLRLALALEPFPLFRQQPLLVLLVIVERDLASLGLAGRRRRTREQSAESRRRQLVLDRPLAKRVRRRGCRRLQRVLDAAVQLRRQGGANLRRRFLRFRHQPVQRLAAPLHPLPQGLAAAGPPRLPRPPTGVDQGLDVLRGARSELVRHPQRDAGTAQGGHALRLLVLAAPAKLPHQRVAGLDELVRGDVGERIARGHRWRAYSSASRFSECPARAIPPPPR